MSSGDLGRVYADGEVIVREGEVGDCMYVIQDGQAVVMVRGGRDEIKLDTLGPGAFFGEMSVIEDKGRLISESGAIIEYLCERHGGENWLPDRSSDAWIDHLEWMQFGGR